MEGANHKERLTACEQRILEHVLRGESNKEIAAQLSCSAKTIEFHLSNIFKKTGVTSRLHLLLRFVEPHRVT